jgi:pilus assembly protein CpaE
MAEPGGHERGQAAVELLAGLPALLAAGLAAFQLLAVGWSLSLADGAAEAGALAAAGGTDPLRAAREALPGWARDRVRVREGGGEVTVELRPPSPLPGLSERLAVTSHAWARPAKAGAAP